MSEGVDVQEVLLPNRDDVLPNTNNDSSEPGLNDNEDAPTDGWIDLDTDDEEGSGIYSIFGEVMEQAMERAMLDEEDELGGLAWCDECGEFHARSDGDEDDVEEEFDEESEAIRQAISQSRKKGEERKTAQKLLQYSIEELQAQLKLTLDKIKVLEGLKQAQSDVVDANMALMRKLRVLDYERTYRQDCLSLHEALYRKLVQQSEPKYQGSWSPIFAADNSSVRTAAIIS